MIFTNIFFTALAASATFVSGASIRRQDEDNGSCAQLGRICAGQVQNSLANVLGVESCLFAGVCFERNSTNLDDFLTTLWETEGHSGTAPKSVSTTRATTAVFDAISTDGQTITQQNFIDGYYGSLDATSGTYPTSAAIVISDFDRVAAWTGFCPGTNEGIPYQNWADYFQYSATVGSTTCQ
ncbi:uncharacterized protein STEHIDRAFT_165874 [Stereum hirsutum FP-91666 SS1]|uniref:uncharacterized protein n=1 Tax=Stereum hirsutum (strain FP-91666) TaxID=721885 RepID=UPI000440F815|nr:uncharacterized protein STEHIDRAFT_165874 [Stereum hirsutum FP-91666 SS1]EIM91638.1 hypothetical protein STEHIDRAFT_165874 [Stereum hirsutum FP-91666 SS1]